MAYLAQDDDAQRRIKSFRLTTADSRASQRDDLNRNTTVKSKKEELGLSKSEASFTINGVVGQVIPVNGGCWLQMHSQARTARKASSESFPVLMSPTWVYAHGRTQCSG